MELQLYFILFWILFKSLDYNSHVIMLRRMELPSSSRVKRVRGGELFCRISVQRQSYSQPMLPKVRLQFLAAAWLCSVLQRRSLPLFQRCFLPSSNIRAIIVLMMGAAGTSETSADFYQATRRNNSEDSHLQSRFALYQVGIELLNDSSSQTLLWHEEWMNSKHNFGLRTQTHTHTHTHVQTYIHTYVRT
jgi:hypothetical protein